jgi:hypothetical protein
MSSESGSVIRTGELPSVTKPAGGDTGYGVAPSTPAPPSGALTPKLPVGKGGRR